MGRNQSYKPCNGKESILQTLQWEGINLTNLAMGRNQSYLAMGRNQSYKPCNGKESILQTLQWEGINLTNLADGIALFFLIFC